MSKKKQKQKKVNNLVAKHAGKFNKAQVHEDKKKTYKRKKKIEDDDLRQE